MTLPGYSYLPIYGVDPYEALGSTPADAFGGGAKVTQQNLIASVLNVTSATAPLTAEVIKPLTAFPGDFNALLETSGLSVGEGANGALPSFESRTAARFLFTWGVAIETEGFIAVLNPPPELRQRMLGNLSAVLDASNPTGYLATLKNGLTNIGSAWDIQNRLSDVLSPGVGFPEPIDGAFGGPTPILNLPFLKTSGADGENPEFYSSPVFGDSAQDVVDDLNALGAGAPFFVPCFFVPNDEESGNLISITWTHSVARGF